MKFTMIVKCLFILGLLVLGAWLFMRYYAPFGDARPRKRHKYSNQIPTSLSMGPTKLFKLWQESRAFRNIRQVRPQTPPKTRSIEPSFWTEEQDTLVSWLGHSALVVRIDGLTLLLDPMLGTTPSPIPAIGGKRFSPKPPLTVAEMPMVDGVILSHDHYDHLDYETIVGLRDKVGHFFVPVGVATRLIQWGVKPACITELSWGQETTFHSLTLVCTPARHFSGRSMLDRNTTLWCSWVIRGKQTKLYFSGDSGYGPHFRTIGETYGPFDLTMMECGQYHDNWADIHMAPEQTVQAHIDVQGQLLLPIHWGAFTLSLHDWRDPIERAVHEADRLGVAVTTPMMGETLRLVNPRHGQQEPVVMLDWPTKAWWRSN